MSNTDQNWIILNGDLCQSDKLVFGVDARSVRYGDGCFETFRSYGGAFLELQYHFDRMKGAMQYLQIAAPASFKADDLINQIHRLLAENRLDDQQSVVRLQVWRAGSRGFAIPKEATSGYCITVSALPEIADSVSLATVPTRRIPTAALNPRFKLSNSLNYIRASSEARKQGADDALLQTVGGAVSETTIANVFWFSKNKVYTPDETCDLLPGITRNIILKILEEQMDVTCQKGAFRPEQMYEAECIWICNSVREIVPVHQVNDHKFAVAHPFLGDLRKRFKQYRQHHLK